MGKIILLVIMIGIAGCTGAPSTHGGSELMGSWTVEIIAGRPVIDRSPAYIEFAQDGRAGGNASCNRFAGSFIQSGPNLSFGQIAVTKMMCPAALMEQEGRFLAGLEKVDRAEFRQGLLVLLDTDGNTMFTASRRENTP